MRAVLGIDTSCYTTSAALVDADGAILADVRRPLPVPPGALGLRQSHAVFAHVRALPALLAETMMQAPGSVLCAVAASARPCDAEHSYMPVFTAGESQARAAASLLRLPFYAVNHQAGHLRAAREGAALGTEDDLLWLHLSGGTTQVLAGQQGRLTLVGRTLDISAGQLVDRVGVALGLPFPCGPHLEALAEAGSPADRGMRASLAGCDCHLSGAEAQCMRWVRAGVPPAQVAARVYAVLCDTVWGMIQAAAAVTGIRRALLAGGVASSALLRRLMADKASGVALHWAQPCLCGDNAVGVALLGLAAWRQQTKEGD
ncbi:MAG: peptidase M22 [Oscillospiraceae bacterium]|jgi:N6-L-threonylcarbamoyladenine synthase|nr:peptidase M22 [Oscillospiraceae bacterium]